MVVFGIIVNVVNSLQHRYGETRLTFRGGHQKSFLIIQKINQKSLLKTLAMTPIEARDPKMTVEGADLQWQSMNGPNA